MTVADPNASTRVMSPPPPTSHPRYSSIGSIPRATSTNETVVLLGPTVARVFFADSSPHQNANDDHPHQQEEVGRHAYHHHQFRKPGVGQDDGTSCGPEPINYRQEAFSAPDFSGQ